MTRAVCHFCGATDRLAFNTTTGQDECIDLVRCAQNVGMTREQIESMYPHLFAYRPPRTIVCKCGHTAEPGHGEGIERPCLICDCKAFSISDESLYDGGGHLSSIKINLRFCADSL